MVMIYLYKYLLMCMLLYTHTGIQHEGAAQQAGKIGCSVLWSWYMCIHIYLCMCIYIHTRAYSMKTRHDRLATSVVVCCGDDIFI